jgi:hypothetical protein
MASLLFNGCDRIRQPIRVLSTLTFGTLRRAWSNHGLCDLAHAAPAPIQSIENIKRFLHRKWRQQMTAKNPSPSPAPSVIKTEVEITDTELAKVTGGKVHIHDMSFARTVDAASPVLMQ